MDKKCARCGAMKPRPSFYRSRSWRDGLHPYCKPCFLAYQSERRFAKLDAANPDRQKWSRRFVKHDYFSRIDEPLKAYLLGLLAADGNVFAPLNRISLELAVKDVELVELARDAYAPGVRLRSRPRRRGMGHVTLAITSAQMASDLGALGVTPRKTLTYDWPPLSGDMARPYLLGHFDGDGFVTVSRNGRYRYPRWGLLGTERFLCGAMEAINQGTGIRSREPRRKETANVWRLHINGADAVVVDEWLHADLPIGLARKRLSALDL